MEEELEIILRAVDEASSTFESVGQSANDMGTTLEQAFEEATAEVERLKSELEFAEEWGFMNDVEELESQLAEAEAEAERLSEALNIDGSPMEDAASAADDLEQEVQEAADAMQELGSAGDVMATETLMAMSEGVASSMMSMADAAGTFEDSVNRASLEAEGFGISADTMKNTISELSETTGRAGGQIRESFIKATARGITDMDSFKQMMEGAGAQAYLLGTDIQTMGDKFSQMAMRSTLMERGLASTGITMEELATAMGMTGATADEVKEKWKELDANERAAALGIAASMNEGKNANEEYKNSWEGLQAQVDIAKGRLERLAGEVLLPVLIPAMQVASGVLQTLGDILSGVMGGPLGGLVSILGTLGGAFLIAVTGAGALRSILGFLKIEATLAAIETTALAFAEELQAGGSIASAAANAIGATGFTGLAASAWAAATAVWAALAPLLPFIAIAVAVAVAIFEVGKAFGWWTDVGSMLDAISAGAQRLWSAFINHPDVQAAIQAVSSALQTLWGYIQQAGQAIMEFFGIATGGEFDVVRAIIDGVGAAWEIFSGHLTAVVTVFTILISIFQAVGEAIGGFWNDTLLPFGEWLSGVFAPVWQLVADLLNAIAPFVSNLTNAFTLFANGQMSLPSLVWTVLTTLLNAYVTIFSLIMSRVTSWGISLLAKGVSVASSFVNNIVNWLRQLPGRALSALLQVVSSIVSAGSQWVSNATSQASSVVSGVVGRLSSLPGQISSALSGVVDAIVSPFRSAYDAVVGVVDSIKSKVQEGLDAIGSLGSGYGSDHTEAGGDHFSAYGNDILPNATEYSVGSGSVEVSGEVTERLILDFQNVPQHIDTAELIEVMKDRRVLETIARSADFQSIDTKVKSEIIGKSKRYYGV